MGIHRCAFILCIKIDSIGERKQRDTELNSKPLCHTQLNILCSDSVKQLVQHLPFIQAKSECNSPRTPKCSKQKTLCKTIFGTCQRNNPQRNINLFSSSNIPWFYGSPDVIPSACRQMFPERFLHLGAAALASWK